MRKIAFTKMQGIGNDYIYIDCTKEEILKQDEIVPFAVRFSDRHFGIGSDGVIMIKNSEKGDFFMVHIHKEIAFFGIFDHYNSVRTDSKVSVTETNGKRYYLILFQNFLFGTVYI